MTAKKMKKPKDISIVLCGQAGQGIQTVERLLTRILKIAGYNVYATKEYMSRVRGGMNSTEIRLSNKPVRAYVEKIDILVPLDKGAIPHLGKRISPKTVIIGGKETLGDDIPAENTFFDVPFAKIGEEIADKVYSNTVAVGVLTGLLGLKLEIASSYLKQFFSGKGDEIIENNVKALTKGRQIGAELAKSGKVDFEIAPVSGLDKQLLINGAEAVGLGSIAGGCNFVSSYPMSPSTGVLVFLAQHADDFGIIAEQAEDEIAAINMALGAWYAGARAMVTTSGGGFALMTEGVSLAGIIESPIVIHLAQRPGPATGLPTRTEQGDLELVLYAGHGEFPRIIFAPGTIEEAFSLAQKAFNLADKFQVPVFILTDQYFMDSYYNVEQLDLSNVKVEKHFVETSEKYKRYELTETGLSPRGIPGFGKGIVCVDSDEHDENGRITEDLDLRVKMVDKRLGKLELIQAEAIEPELIGSKKYKNLIICWGTTYHIVAEAVENLGRSDTAVLHFSQVYPLHPSTAGLLDKADKTIVVEINATAQFARLLKIHANFDVDHKILKYNGLNFGADELAEKLKHVL